MLETLYDIAMKFSRKADMRNSGETRFLCALSAYSLGGQFWYFRSQVWIYGLACIRMLLLQG